MNHRQLIFASGFVCFLVYLVVIPPTFLDHVLEVFLKLTILIMDLAVIAMAIIGVVVIFLKAYKELGDS